MTRELRGKGSKPLRVLRWVRSERVARGEANDEVDRSGRRYADEGAERAAGAAPEGGRSGFQAEGGDCPHSEGRGLHLEFQGNRGRRSQSYPYLFEVRRAQRGSDFEGGARVASRLPGLRAAQRDSPRAGRDGDQHSHHATRGDDGTPGAQGRRGRRVIVRDLVGKQLSVISRPLSVGAAGDTLRAES